MFFIRVCSLVFLVSFSVFSGTLSRACLLCQCVPPCQARSACQFLFEPATRELLLAMCWELLWVFQREAFCHQFDVAFPLPGLLQEGPGKGHAMRQCDSKNAYIWKKETCCV